MEFMTWMNQNLKIVDHYLEKILPEPLSRQQQLYQSMRYSLLSGGKRIRPLLMLASYELFQKDSTPILPYAAAVEMIHAYSLIHDDLPAMDNDDFRRGKPTNHKVYGEAMAILAGDALLNKAVEIILDSRSTSHFSDATILDCLSVLMTASGSQGMIGGQVVDMFVQEKSQDYLEHMHRLKTGALIQASCEIGAIAGQGSHEEIKAVKEYARLLGLAFQVKDDILDYTSTEEVLGKPIGSDEKNNKLTYVSLLGLEASNHLLNQYTQEAIAHLSVFQEKKTRLLEIADYLLKRTK